MAHILDVPTQELIEKTAEQLEADGLVTPPSWSQFVKTGAHKERPPTQDNWWYLRAASILRKLRKHGPLGVQKLRSQYGGPKNNGHRPSHHAEGGGAVIRHILQQLEESGLVTKEENSLGRMLTQDGISLLTDVASTIEKNG